MPRPRLPRPRTALALFGACGLLGGCAGGGESSARGETPRKPLAQGGSWELVLPTREVAAVRQQTPLDELPEYGRRDRELALRTPRSPTALDSWPTSEPSLFWSYRLRVPNRAEDVLVVPPHGGVGPRPVVVPPPHGRYPTDPPRVLPWW